MTKNYEKIPLIVRNSIKGIANEQRLLILLHLIEKKDVKISHLEPDLKARGLSFDGEKVDYDGLLDLIEKYDNIYH